MKVRHAALLLVCVASAVVAAGCGSESDSTSDAKLSKAEKAIAVDRENKEKALDAAKKAFKKNPSDVGLCRNEALMYSALASPASAPDSKTPPPPVPKDRDENIKKANGVLLDCLKLDADNIDVKRSLAANYQVLQDYDKAVALYQELVKSASAAEKTNLLFQLGIAASQAQDYQASKKAYEQFVASAPAKDPRLAMAKQNIKSLELAIKNPPKPAATDEQDEKKSDSKED